MSVKTHQAFLQVLATSTRKQALALIKTMSSPQLNAICEILINIQYGNVPVNDAVKKKLQRKKNIIWELTSKSIGTKLRKTLIEKEVGLIVYVVKLILPQLKKDSVMADRVCSHTKTQVWTTGEGCQHQRMEIYQHHYCHPHHLMPQINDNQSDLSHEGPDDSNTDDDYDVSDVLESFNSTKLTYVQPIITLMENNTDVLTWNRKTGEIVFL